MLKSSGTKSETIRVAEVKTELWSFAFSCGDLCVHYSPQPGKGEHSENSLGERRACHYSGLTVWPRDKVLLVLLSKAIQTLVCSFHHCYQLSPNQSHLKHKLDYVTYLLNITSIHPHGFPPHSAKSNIFTIARDRTYGSIAYYSSLVHCAPATPASWPSTPYPRAFALAVLRAHDLAPKY